MQITRLKQHENVSKKKGEIYDKKAPDTSKIFMGFSEDQELGQLSFKIKDPELSISLSASLRSNFNTRVSME